MSELKVSLRRIAEDAFTRNEEIIADESKNIIPQIGFELLSDINKNLLTIAAQIVYVTPEKEIAAGLRYHYTLEVISLSDLQYVSNPEKGTHDYKFPNGFIEAVITDVYATGRVMMANKLAGTRLESLYLPFGGATNLIKMMKKK